MSITYVNDDGYYPSNEETPPVGSTRATNWSSASKYTSNSLPVPSCSRRRQNRFGDEPNTNIDPVTLGLPGALPVLNRQAVELAISPRPCTQLHRSEVDVRPQELLLSGHAQGVSDQPVRRADQPSTAGSTCLTVSVSASSVATSKKTPVSRRTLAVPAAVSTDPTTH